VLTPDSSRYWLYHFAPFSVQNKPTELSKEFVRQGIIELMIEQGLVPPDPSDEEIKAAAAKVVVPPEKFGEWSDSYVKFFRAITGKDFDPDEDLGSPFAYEILEQYVEEVYE